jgi:hypothetical protein
LQKRVKFLIESLLSTSAFCGVWSIMMYIYFCTYIRLKFQISVHCFTCNINLYEMYSECKYQKIETNCVTAVLIPVCKLYLPIKEMFQFQFHLM